jgi:hypothetical protein
MKIPQLRQTAQSFGLALSGTKRELISRISTHISSTLEPQRILAIDLGLVNLSYISASTSLTTFKVHDWSLIDLKLQKYDPIQYTLEIQALTDRMLQYNPTNIIIEAQSWRSRIPMTILKLKSLEAILVGCIISKGFNPHHIDLVSPKKVSDYLSTLDNINWKSGSNYRVKKNNAITLVETLMNKIDLNGIDTFKKSKKKDDLADSFLLAYVWNEWRQNALKAKGFDNENQITDNGSRRFRS